MPVVVNDNESRNRSSRVNNVVEIGTRYVQKHEGKDDIVSMARQRLDDAATEEGWNETREQALESFEFINGQQWDQGILQARNAAGRPSLTINKVRKFVNLVVGEWRQNKSTLKIRPVDDKADPKTAEVYEGLIRDIEYQSDAEVAYQRALEHAAVGGFGWLRATVELASDEPWRKVIRIRHASNPFSVYIDPLSRRHDLSDCRYVLVTDWMPRDEHERRFPDVPMSDVETGTGDLETPWSDTSEGLVRVAEYWWRERYARKMMLVKDAEGQLRYLDITKHADAEWVKFLRSTGAVVREDKVESSRIRYALVNGIAILEGPYDWIDSEFPFAPVYGEEAIVDGIRYLTGLVHGAKDPQRAYNLYRSFIMEILALQPKVPWVGRKGSFGVGPTRTAWENSHIATIPFLEYEGDIPPTRADAMGFPTGMDNEGRTATSDLKETTGLFDENIGTAKGDKSGKAILALQQQGSAATSIYPENLKNAQKHLGRRLVAMIQKVYTQPQIIRTLGEDRETVEMSAINGARMYGPDGQPLPTYDLMQGKYDVIVTLGPSYASRRMEAFDALREFGQMLGPERFNQIADLVAQYADWPGGDDVAERIRQLNGQGGTISPEMQQAIQQIVAQTITQSVPDPQSIVQMIRSEIQQALGGRPPAGPPPGPPPGPRPGPPQAGPPMRPPMRGGF